MTASVFSGPLVSAGSMFGGNSGSAATPSATAVNAGPSVFYQGAMVPDVRFTPLNKDNLLPGTVKGIYESPPMYSVDAVPQTAGAAKIAALQNVTNGTAMTLAAASTGIAVNIPINPYKSQNVVTGAIVIDFGFQNGNVTSGSTTVVVTDSSKFTPGEPLVIAGVGNAGGTVPLLTNVVSITDATHIVIANSPLATNSAAPIGTGDSWGALYNGPKITPTFWQPYLQAGPSLVFDPTQGIARGVSITGVSGGAGGAFLVSGYDIYGQPMSQTITVAAGVNTVNSTKAFKVIQSITPQFTDAHNYSVGTADIYGFNTRADRWEYVDVYFNGALITSSTGFVAADTTNPATATTGDVRGTMVETSDGTKRLVMSSTPTVFASISASPNFSQTLYGVTQA